MSSIEDFNSKFGNFAKICTLSCTFILVEVDGYCLSVGFHDRQFYIQRTGRKYGDGYLTFDNCDEKIKPLVNWCRETLIKSSGEKESYFDKKCLFVMEDSEDGEDSVSDFEELEVPDSEDSESDYSEPEQNYEETIKWIQEHIEQREKRVIQDFKKQNFEITSLDGLEFQEILNPITKNRETFLEVKFSYGLEPICISLKRIEEGDLKSLNKLVEIDRENCMFMPLQNHVPTGKLHDFEEIFRWCLKNFEIRKNYNLFLREIFPTSNEVFTKRAQNAIHKKFGIDLEIIECTLNEGGNRVIYFELKLGEKYWCCFKIKTFSISVCGMTEISDGKFVQNCDIDETIPMDKRKYVIDLIKFCAALVGNRTKLTFDIEREATEFEKNLCDGHYNVYCVYDGEIWYEDSRGQMVSYKITDQPKNKREREFEQNAIGMKSHQPQFSRFRSRSNFVFTR